MLSAILMLVCLFVCLAAGCGVLCYNGNLGHITYVIGVICVTLLV